MTLLFCRSLRYPCTSLRYPFSARLSLSFSTRSPTNPPLDPWIPTTVPSLSFQDEPDPSLSYPIMTPKETFKLTSPPRGVKMLTGDFIEDALYNPNYGYFSKRGEVFDPDIGSHRESRQRLEGKRGEGSRDPQAPSKGFDFPSLSGPRALEKELERRYRLGEEEFEERQRGDEGLMRQNAGVGGVERQVWHTPTEMFKPHYARMVARHILRTYKKDYYSQGHDLLIFEMGGGNGSMMHDVLAYIREQAEDDSTSNVGAEGIGADIWRRTKYRVVEISGKMVDGLRKKVDKAGWNGPASSDTAPKVEIIHSSILDWKETIDAPCFVLSFEVFDNLPHDAIRYTTSNHTPLQSLVAISPTGDLSEVFAPTRDSILSRFLRLRSLVPPTSPLSLRTALTGRSPKDFFASSRHIPFLNSAQFKPQSLLPRFASPFLYRSARLRSLYASGLPFAPNLTRPEFIPTRLLKFLEVLKTRFPQHRIVWSDFAELGEGVGGRRGPVVQARIEGMTVPCTTYLTQPGYFDIFFPTDFALLKDLYQLVMHPDYPFDSNNLDEGDLSSSTEDSKLTVKSHQTFLRELMTEDERKLCRLRDGSEPIFEWYGNVGVVCN